MRALGAPAPAVRDVVDVDGRASIVFERVHGPSMWDEMVASPERAPALALELAVVHQRILSAGLPEDLAGLVDRMCAKIDEVDQVSPAERAEAREIVAGLPRGAALLHGDLHPGNVLMAEDGPVVIDWFDATVSHPVADVVRSSLLLRSFGPRSARPHLPGADAGLLEEVHRAYLDTMDGVLADAGDEFRRWEAVVALSRLAERAESDESSLLALWRRRTDGESSRENSGGSPDQSPE